MNDLIIYLLKVSAGLGIIVLPYYFLMRNDPNLSLKRIYLVLGILAAWISPLMVFQKPDVLVSLTPVIFMDLDSAGTLPIASGIEESPAGIAINWVKVLLLGYSAGLTFMLIKNLIIVIKYNLDWRRNHDDNGITFTQSGQVFTLFTRIFVPRSLRDEQDLENILHHERAHVQQMHYLDLILMELTLLLTWFNPFSWLISRMIKENHEHLADRKVLAEGVNPALYRAQLLNHTLGVNVFRLGNQFNHSLTLKRFKMMKKPKRSYPGMAKMAFLLPVILISLGVLTGMTAQKNRTVKGKVVFAQDGTPAPGTSIICEDAATGHFINGTVADVDGKFRLEVQGDPVLVVSFVGYATLRVKASDANENTLELYERPHTLDLQKVNAGGISYEASDGITVHQRNGSGEEPVIVLDGNVVVSMENLDPDKIKSIQVINDSDHEMAKKYKAKDGLILIVSKNKSKPRKPPAAAKKARPGEPEEEVFFIVEDMPSFPGGKVALKSFIYSNLVYPEKAKKIGISGEVEVAFTVSHTGQLENIHVVRSVYPGFDEPAMKVFRDMPAWNPGKQRGKPVPIQIIIPVRFKANQE